MPRYREQIIESLAPLFEGSKHQDWQSDDWDSHSWMVEIIENGKATYYYPASQRNEDGSYSMLLAHPATGFGETEAEFSEVVQVNASYRDATDTVIATHNSTFDAGNEDWSKRFISEAQAEAVSAMKKQG